MSDKIKINLKKDVDGHDETLLGFQKVEINSLMTCINRRDLDPYDRVGLFERQLKFVTNLSDEFSPA